MVFHRVVIVALIASVLTPADAWARGGGSSGGGLLIAFAVLFATYFVIKLIKEHYPGFFPAIGSLLILFSLAIGAAEVLRVLGVIDSSTVPWLAIALLVAVFAYALRLGGASSGSDRSAVADPVPSQPSDPPQAPPAAKDPRPIPAALPPQPRPLVAPQQHSSHPERYCAICRTLVLPKRRIFRCKQCPHCNSEL